MSNLKALVEKLKAVAAEAEAALNQEAGQGQAQPAAPLKKKSPLSKPDSAPLKKDVGQSTDATMKEGLNEDCSAKPELKGQTAPAAQTDMADQAADQAPEEKDAQAMDASPEANSPPEEQKLPPDADEIPSDEINRDSPIGEDMDQVPGTDEMPSVEEENGASQAEDTPEMQQENEGEAAPQEGMCYLAGDGDNIGAKVGQAVLSDDVESLHSTSQAINAGQNLVMDWCEQNGGRVISAGGDEFVLEMPSCDPQALEDLRSQYAQAVGATCTIGVGTSMSQAGKALIAGKLNGKDQICNYDESIEQQLQSAHEGAQAAGGEAQKQDDHYLSSMYQDKNQAPNEQEQADEPEQMIDAVAPPGEEAADQNQEQQAMLDAVAQGGQQEGSEASQDPALNEAEEAPASANQDPFHDDSDPRNQDEGQQDPSMSDVMNDQVDRGNGENIKAKLAEILQAFRADQSFVENTREANPELYRESMVLLQQMIKVARMVGPSAAPADAAPQQDPAAAPQPGSEPQAEEKAPFPPKKDASNKDGAPAAEKETKDKDPKKPFSSADKKDEKKDSEKMEKAVQQPGGKPGESNIGSMVRTAKFNKESGYPKDAKNTLEQAKQEQKNELYRTKTQPKPNLPK